MVKKYDKKLIKIGVLNFISKLHFVNEKRSIVLFSCPFPAIKKIGLDKNSEYEITIVKKDG